MESEMIEKRFATSVASRETDPLMNAAKTTAGVASSHIGTTLTTGTPFPPDAASAPAATTNSYDDYIIRLIRRDSTNKTNNQNDPTTFTYTAALKDDTDDQDSLVSGDDVDVGEDLHQTTYGQTVIHLVKGYIGCGILSLPWAMSQLGLPLGLGAIVLMSLWSSYNCWTVVELKRYIERTNELALAKPPNDTQSEGGRSSHHGSTTTAQSIASSSNITYPDVGEWAHGGDFQKYVAACICAQQLAICTVFMSFVGENLYAVLEFLNIAALKNHQAVISVVLPAMMALSFIPSLKSLAPVMLAGTVLIMAGFSSLAVIGAIEWGNRPNWGDMPTLNPIKAPMALCGILYSFEGICIILPVESAMKEPKHFQSAFWTSMTIVTLLLCGMAGLATLAFGDVTNGSITAYLLEEYKNDDRMKLWLMMSNLLVSMSIILTYPLMLFPAVELVAPMSQGWLLRRTKCCRQMFGFNNDVDDDDDGDDGESSDHDLEGFERMAGIPEHEIASMGSLPSQSQYHNYDGTENNNTNGNEQQETGKMGIDGETDNASLSRLSSTGNLSVADLIPERQIAGDSMALRAALVLSTYLVAMVVPKVESLVSLAGAVAGSSTALLIPPILELAFIRHMEKDGIAPVLSDWEGGPSEASKNTLVVHQQSTSISGGNSPLPRRPYLNPNIRKQLQKRHFLTQKIVSWFLLVMGLIFAAFGSYFSVRDIFKTYAASS
ncbi:transmembrane amino acid transporter [Nitzschia inconspicua]|uniref:Transmembrane amino acid transporter n=1 Tax=Nitzschia inconspicua TaxID=303405 RepID=A0A9K3PG89_9STRA|nr:transmembrane amino acid transporter [Nitzschia inconspicua]